jgi:DNA primase
MDVLRLSQEGIEAVVATCGTALTPEHGKTLGRYAENIIVVFDGDTAGVAAALKAGDTLLEGGVSPSVVLLPEGEDPDSFVSKNGPDALNLMVDKAQDFLAFKWDRSALEHGTDTVEGRHAVVADMLDSVALVGDDMKSRMHVHEIADRAAVDENLVLKALSRRKQGGRTRQEPSAEVPQESVGWRAPDWQKRMLALMLDQPDVCLEVDEIVGVDGFSDELGKRIAQKLIELSRTGDQPSATLVMGQDTDPRETRAVAELAQFTLGKTGLDEARKQIRRLRIESVDVEMSNLDARLDGLKAGSKEHRDVLKGLSDLSMQRVELSELIRKNEAS